MATNEIQNGCESSIEAVLASNHKRRCDYAASSALLNETAKLGTFAPFYYAALDRHLNR
jgi:hypothetical protein